MADDLRVGRRDPVTRDDGPRDHRRHATRSSRRNTPEIVDTYGPGHDVDGGVLETIPFGWCDVQLQVRPNDASLLHEMLLAGRDEVTAVAVVVIDRDRRAPASAGIAFDRRRA